MAFGSGPSLGAVLLGESTAGHVVEQARAAERAGLDSLWFIEDYFQTGAFAAAGAAAAVTTRLDSAQRRADADVGQAVRQTAVR